MGYVMINIKEFLNKTVADWESPRKAIQRGVEIPFLLKCSLSLNGKSEEIICDNYEFPEDLYEFYKFFNGAILFEDAIYGQWGLKLYSFQEAFESTEIYEKNRSNEVQKGDLIVGEFIGDSDLLLVRCDKLADDFGTSIVVNPIDFRSEWDVVEKNFSEFIYKYCLLQGDKYWEIRNIE